MAKRKQDEMMHDDGTYVVKKSRNKNIVAFILCVLVALMIWLYASNVEKEKQQETPPSGTNAVMAEEAFTDRNTIGV